MRANGTLGLALGALLATAGVDALAARAQDAELDAASQPEAAPEAATTDAEQEAIYDRYAQMSLEELLGVAVSASRREESVAQAPASVTVIEQDDIRASGARTIPDLLRLVPGIQVVRSAPGSFVVAMRGMGSLSGNNLIVLLDGTPLNSPLDGEVDWASIPVSVDDIARIEVVRGPVSPIYGPNAYTGMIRIDTTPVPDADGASAGARVVGGIDTSVQPMAELSAWFRGRRGPLSASVQGRAALDDTFTRSMGGAQQPGLRTFGLAGRLRLDLSSNVYLTLDASGSVGERAALDYLVTDRSAQLGSRTGARLELTIAEVIPEIRAIRLWTRGRWLTHDSDDTVRSTFRYASTQAGETMSGLDVELALPEHIEITIGADGGAAYVDAPFIHPDENAVLRASFGAYVNGDVEIAQILSIAAAGRMDITAFAEDPQLSGRLSVVLFERDYSLRLTAASAFRNPTYVEVASRFRDPATQLILLEGTAGLAIPRVESVEAGFAIGVDGRFTLHGSAYVARAVDLIVGDFTPLTRKTFRTEPDDRAFGGGELEAEWTITDELRLLASVAGVGFFTEATNPGLTVGVNGHNSLITGTAELRGSVPDARLQLTGGASFFSERSYNLRVGIPPRLVRQYVPHSVRLHATGTWQPIASVPLDLTLIVVAHLPHELIESPLPSAGALGSYFLLGLALHTD